MDIVRSAKRVVTGTADATAAAAGAVGGAAVNGVIGGVQGTVGGMKSGLASGRHSAPAAVLTFAAVGVAGLVDWPVLVAIGGTALLVGQLTKHSGGQPTIALVTAPSSTRRAGPAKPATRKPRTAPRKSTSSRRSSSQ
ncbi:MAG: hypothetical protein ACXWD5_17930 [Mycobacterium sp.]